ncbi:DMT family transporter [Thiothrix unzii]|jgi:Predicted permeases|uniref:DMT family transporter n=1 Tax=Thiothrix unzii TaxID=111769 RepID=A0A975IFU4_9GAMM|nr:DMT family transporter [Thiothrix unzii]MDX9990327.1 DMT family transporter [Thiothrix unzii]QTR52012.1 DMT family transporter [Thiothrix unzii]
MKMQRLVAIAALLYSAISWGLFWYPFRLLEGWGVGGLAAIFIAYLLPLLGIGWWYGKALWQVRRHWLWLTVLGFASGWSNVGYVLGVLEGEVMRVLLLFYLAPLWTVLLAWVFLRERLSTLGWWVIVLSLGGAMVMLWQPQAGLPLPANVAEWLGLSAGMTFALSVVAGRHLGDAVSDWVKTVAVWLGVAVLTGVGLLFYPQQITGMVYSWDAAWLLLGLAVAIALVTYAVQYGVARIPASQSSVIFLFELVVAAIAAYWLTHERMVLNEWIGAAMILTASLFSGRMQQD